MSKIEKKDAKYRKGHLLWRTVKTNYFILKIG